MNNTFIESNSAKEGGGLYISAYDKALVIKNSRIINNTSTSSAGGLYYRAASANIYNTEISGNSAGTGKGGGIYVDTGGMVLYNVTLAGNTAGSGGGAYVYSTSTTAYSLTTYNSIVLGNTGGDVTLSAKAFLQGYNNLTSSTTWVTANSGNNLTSTSPTFVFVTPSNKDFRLKTGSAAIDAGDNSRLSSYLYLTDIAGNTRKYNGTIDMGAYEYVGPITTPLTGISLSSNTPQANTSLTATVTPSGATASYQWSYGSTAAGTFTNISGATYASFTPSSAYVGYYLRCTATGTGDYSGTVYATATSAVTATLSPTISASSTGANSISVTVGSVSNASGYRLQYSTSSSFTNAVTQTVSAGVTSITGLNANTTYYFSVTAIGTGNYTDSSASTASATTDKIQVFVSISKTKINVSWDGGEAGVPDVMRYRMEGSSKWTVKNMKAGVQSYAFSGKAGRSYEIEVWLDGLSSQCITTNAAILAAPKLKADKASIRDDFFRVNVTNWSASNLTAEAQNVNVSLNGMNVSFAAAAGAAGAEFTNGVKVTFTDGTLFFSNAASSMKCAIQVSFADDTSSSAASKVSVKTLAAPYLAPANVQVQSVGDTSLLVTWNASQGKNSTQTAQRYTVQYSVDGGSKWKSATTKGTNGAFTITKLKAATDYMVRVLATKDRYFLVSDPSETVSATTWLATPKIASVTSKTSGTALVTWTAVSRAEKYEVQYRVAGASAWISVEVPQNYGVKKQSCTVSDLEIGKTYEFQIQVKPTATLHESLFSAVKKLKKVK